MKQFLLLAALPGALLAQALEGTWQGTLKPPNQNGELRIVIKIAKNGNAYQGSFHNLENGRQFNLGAITLQGSTVKIAIPGNGLNYDGKIEADGNSITGAMAQGANPIPLNLAKATASTAWVIPEPPPPPRAMAADAKPSFEVATIKPSNPQATGQAINVGRAGGNSFTTMNTPLSELIKFTYALHADQVVGGPSWMALDKFDVLAKPDTPGIPNVTQLRSMVQKLLAERFGLEYHREKKEVSAYVITVDKAGVKMAKVEGNRGNLPGFGGRGPGAIGVRNSTMTEFAEFLQSRILERPVVDHSGLTDRYDFTLEWRPEAAQLAAIPGPNPPALPQNIEDRPDLISAMRQQLGLKVESGKAQVEVLVIDKVTKPTEN